MVQVSWGIQIFLFLSPHTWKSKEWHSSQRAGCRGRLREHHRTNQTSKLLFMQIPEDPCCWACSPCACTHCISLCVGAAGRNVQASPGSYLCVTARGTMQRADARPTATFAGLRRFLYLHSSKSDLPLRPSSSVAPFLFVFFVVFYFLIPHLEGKLRISLQLLWQPLFASEKVHLKGPTKCATVCFGIVLNLPRTADMSTWGIRGGSLTRMWMSTHSILLFHVLLIQS